MISVKTIISLNRANEQQAPSHCSKMSCFFLFFFLKKRGSSNKENMSQQNIPEGLHDRLTMTSHFDLDGGKLIGSLSHLGSLKGRRQLRTNKGDNNGDSTRQRHQPHLKLSPENIVMAAGKAQRHTVSHGSALERFPFHLAI